MPRSGGINNVIIVVKQTRSAHEFHLLFAFGVTTVLLNLSISEQSSRQGKWFAFEQGGTSASFKLQYLLQFHP